MITPEQLAHWRKLADEATDAPPESSPSVVRNWKTIQTVIRVNTLPLINEVESLQARVAELEDTLNSFRNERDREAQEIELWIGKCNRELIRAQTAEAENGRLRAALTALKRHCFKHHQGDDSCNCAEIDAALAAPAPETGEREAVAEALLQWAGEHYLRAWDVPICVYCGGTINASTSSGHKPDCLHLRAKALRAQAGGEG